jgi:dihydrofolate reductase (trimethoprim resistance protein)
MKLALIAARSENDIIGNGLEIPWRARGEQLLFKGLTFNSWLIVGRKTFEAMGKLPDRKFAVISASGFESDDDDVRVFNSVDSALEELAKLTDQAFIAGGGQIYAELIDRADVLHLTRIQAEVEGDISFPVIPEKFSKVFEQEFQSNINYSYEIWLPVARNGQE